MESFEFAAQLRKRSDLHIIALRFLTHLMGLLSRLLCFLRLQFGSDVLFGNFLTDLLIKL